MACLSQAAYAQERSFDVSPQSAVTSIPLFARQAGVQILAPTDQLAGVKTREVKGAYSRAEALRILLKGTPLVVASDDGSTVVLKIAPKGKPTPDAAPDVVSTADHPTDEVVVRGYRESLASATAVKRRAVGAEDVINADDIAGFPDLNLAESLQRIPGVVITRDAGEGRQIALRGLGPDFTRTQLNGMEVLTNTASGMDNRGNVSRTRAFDYSMFASELFDRVTVQKSYAAEQDEGGIGGTVQLSTAKPFDYPGAELVLSAKGQTNSNTNGVTPRVVGLISDRWGPFGALLSVAYSENKSNEYGYRSYGWGPSKVNAANIGPGVSAADAALLEGGSIYAPQANTLSTWYTDRKRLGITSSLQYHPNDRLSVDLDMIYGKLTNDRTDFALATSGTNGLTGPITGTQMINAATIRGNTLVAADYTGVDLRSEHNFENDNTNFYQTVLNGSYRITDKLTAKFMGGYSRSVYSLPVFIKTYLESKNHSIDVNDTSQSPSNTYDNITDPSAWNLMRADAQQNGIVSQYKTGKGDLIYSFDNGSALKGGVMYKDFSNSGWQRYNKQLYNPGNVDTVIPSIYKGLFNYNSYAPYVVGDVYSLYNYIGKPINLTSAYNQPGSNYQVGEKTVSAYVQYDMTNTLFDHRVRSNFGVRYYSTDLTSSGTQSQVVAGVTTLVPVTDKHTYHDFLPAANIAINLNDDLLLRFSADRNVSRPALSDLAAAATVNNSALGGSITAGNPDLKPMTANSAEASLEYYAGKSGYLSAGVFFKNMESFITSQSSQVPYGSTGYPLSYLLPNQTGSIIYTYSRPLNSKGADIYGVELAAQHDLDFLPAPFDKFGVNVNMTYAEGYQNNTYNLPATNLTPALQYIVSVPLYNLSKYAVNATLYYATKQFDARISLAYRSDYLTGPGSVALPGVLNNVGDGNIATTNVDFAAHYNLGNHLTLVVEGINLTDQAIAQWTGVNVKRPDVYTTAGRTFTFGASYRF